LSVAAADCETPTERRIEATVTGDEDTGPPVLGGAYGPTYYAAFVLDLTGRTWISSRTLL
jgi:hypothetical protein